MGKEKGYGCVSCDFANPLEDGGVYCDKRIYEGVEVYIGKEKVDLPSPCHSRYPREEIRYNRSWKMYHEADDVCCICSRDLHNVSDDKYQVIGGSNLTCNICIEKGRCGA